LESSLAPGDELKALLAGNLVSEGRRFGRSTEEPYGDDVIVTASTTELLMLKPRSLLWRVPLEHVITGTVAYEGRGKCLLLIGPSDGPLDAVTTPPDDAERLVGALGRSSVAVESGTSDDAVRIWPAQLLVASVDMPIKAKSWVSMTVLQAGVQIRTALSATGAAPRHDERWFLPLSRITGLAIEGPDAARLRPSVAAVAAFGVLGLAARKSEKRSYLTISQDTGDVVLEVHDRLPVELRGLLRKYPALSNVATDPEPADEDTSTILEQIRTLGGLRDAGYVSADEFEAKKKDLLGRL